jgi:uncharacterized protein YecE (DUF72 family)
LVKASLFTNESPAWKLFRSRGIRVGTASWTDKSLLEPGLFYPRGMSSAADRLSFYAENFPLVEVDATYYALPAQRNAEVWVERTPDGFLFNVKAFALMTQHPTKPGALPKELREGLPEDVLAKKRVYPRDLPSDVVDESWKRFLAALEPLHRASKLGAILFQFPEWFPPSIANKDYVIECGDRLAALLPDAACAVEFRNEGWMRDTGRQERTLSMLAEHGLTYVCVDMPQGFPTSIPPVAAATAPLAVVRFHGRRSDTWGQRGTTTHEKFGYDYSPHELAEWEPKVEELATKARETHLLMNNCYRDYAVRSANVMAQLALDHVA